MESANNPKIVLSAQLLSAVFNNREGHANIGKAIIGRRVGAEVAGNWILSIMSAVHCGASSAVKAQRFTVGRVTL